MTEDQKKESAVQSLIGLAQQLRPWSEEFKGRLGMVMCGYAKHVAGRSEAIDVLQAGFLRVCTLKYGKDHSEAIERAIEAAKGTRP